MENINLQNHSDWISQNINILPEELKNIALDIDGLVEYYNEDKDVKETVDLFMQKVNGFLKKGDNDTLPKKKEKEQREVDILNSVMEVEGREEGYTTEDVKRARESIKPVDTLSKKKPPQKTKRKAEKEVEKQVFKNKIPPQNRILVRYLRTVSSKTKPTKDKLVLFLNYIQRAILRGDIVTKSSYSEEVMKIQKYIVTALNENKKIKQDDEILTIANKVKDEKAVPLISLYNATKNNKKESIERVNKNIDKNILTDKQKQAKKDIETKGSVIKPLAGIMSANEIANKDFSIFDMGDFSSLFGMVSLPFTSMIHGKPGSGKSTFAVTLAGFLAMERQKKVLYISKEEGYNATMKEKLVRLGLHNLDNLHFSITIPENWQDYDFMFVDSVGSLRLTYKDFETLIKNRLDTSIFFIFQATKSGNFRGSQEYEHEVDVSFVADRGKIEVNKNRFGGTGSFNVF